MKKLSRSLETVEAVHTHTHTHTHTSNFIEDIKGFKNLSFWVQKQILILL